MKNMIRIRCFNLLWKKNAFKVVFFFCFFSPQTFGVVAAVFPPNPPTGHSVKLQEYHYPPVGVVCQ